MNGTTSSTRRVPRLLAAVVIATTGATTAYVHAAFHLGIKVGNYCCSFQCCHFDSGVIDCLLICDTCQPGDNMCETDGGCDGGAWATADCHPK